MVSELVVTAAPRVATTVVVGGATVVGAIGGGIVGAFIPTPASKSGDACYPNCGSPMAGNDQNGPRKPDNSSQPNSPNDPPPDPKFGDLRRLTDSHLAQLARGDGYKTVEAWKTNGLGLNSRDDIFVDAASGRYYSMPR